MEETTITLTKTTILKLIEWYKNTNKDNFKEKYFPFENKPHVFTTREQLLNELKQREINPKELTTFKLLQLYNEHHYKDQYSVYFFKIEKNKRDKKVFIFEDQKLFRLKTLSKEINKRKIDLKKINTKQLLSLYKTYNRTENGLFVPYEMENITHIKEMKKELDTRENILNKTESKNIRKICAKHKISKSKAIKILKETK